MTALMKASRGGHTSTVRVLVEAGADKEAKGCERGQYEVLKWKKHHGLLHNFEAEPACTKFIRRVTRACLPSAHMLL